MRATVLTDGLDCPRRLEQWFSMSCSLCGGILTVMEIELMTYPRAVTSCDGIGLLFFLLSKKPTCVRVVAVRYIEFRHSVNVWAVIHRSSM